MDDQFRCGDIVRLISFHNTVNAPDNIDEKENYWKLIGSLGEIVSKKSKSHPAFKNMGKRVLVKFDDVEKYGLYCHNEIPNSLWIFLTDIEVKPHKSVRRE